jgi:hypothetical protein
MGAHFTALAVIMTVFGILGGLISYLLADADRNKTEGEHLNPGDLLKSIIIGVGAAYLVPLFLSVLSSGMVSESRDDPYKLLTFAGYCLIAAISSKTFIHSLSKKVIKDIQKESENMKMKLDVLEKDIKPLLETERKNK